MDADTSLDVYEKVIAQEKLLITKNIKRILLGEYELKSPPFEGNYNGISDFRKICKLDLESIGTLREHINLLRATSHGEFWNAYFMDEGENKCYVKIVIKKE